MSVDMNAWGKVVKQQIRWLADEDGQRRAWFGFGPEIDDPGETFCGYFGDAAIEEFLERDDTGWSDEQLEAARHLTKLMNRLSDETPDHIKPADLIDDPRWIQIRQAAAKLVALLG